MRILFYILVLIPLYSYSQEYSLNLSLKEGDIILYVDSDQTVKKVTQGFGYTFMTVIKEEAKKGNSVFPLMWIDFTDTSKFLYNIKDSKKYVYQINDKGFGRNNMIQENEALRPIFDSKTKSLFFLNGSFLSYRINYAGYELTGQINSFFKNSVYFIVFINKSELEKFKRSQKTITI